jgi:hypothetical protein
MLHVAVTGLFQHVTEPWIFTANFLGQLEETLHAINPFRPEKFKNLRNTGLFNCSNGTLVCSEMEMKIQAQAPRTPAGER